MSNAILDTFIPTVSFINNDATSAGVIIILRKIVAVPGHPSVLPKPGRMKKKYISYWSSALRGVAEKTGRDPDLVAAMAVQMLS